jgi:folate-binding protein YgfZ
MDQRACHVALPARGLISVSGADARTFLQGLISNDIEKATPGRAIYAALLTPQGKFLHDFFIAVHGAELLLDCEAARLPDLGQRLAAYRLRAAVVLADASEDYLIAAVLGHDATARLGLPETPGACRDFAGGLAFVDPRRAALGARVLLPAAGGHAPLEAAGLPAAPFEVYERERLRLGLPDGSRDLEVEKAILLEGDFEALHGVDFGKGCYVGQELTARTKFRGLIKRRLMPVRIEGPPPAPGTPLHFAGKEAGEMRTSLGDAGLALIRLDRLAEAAGAPFEAGAARLWPRAAL